MNKREILDELKNKRVPIKVIAQLTMKCNFRCAHCYETPIKKNALEDINAEKWIQILKNLRMQGCMYLTLTGGEIFTRQDFKKIYVAAYEMGYHINLNTNGSLITNEYIQLFAKKKPDKIYITVYGATQQVYTEFCGFLGDYRIVRENIIALKQAGLQLCIMYISNKKNINDLQKVYSFAKNYNIEFQQYYKIRSYVDGDCLPQKYQLDAKSLLDKQPVEEYENLKYAFFNKPIDWKNDIKNCMAGITTFRIDNKGQAFLCELIPAERYSLLNYDYTYIWNQMLEQRKKYIEIKTQCSRCKNRQKCGMCAPCINTEYNSSEDVPIRNCIFTKKLEDLLRRNENV